MIFRKLVAQITKFATPKYSYTTNLFCALQKTFCIFCAPHNLWVRCKVQSIQYSLISILNVTRRTSNNYCEKYFSLRCIISMIERCQLIISFLIFKYFLYESIKLNHCQLFFFNSIYEFEYLSVKQYLISSLINCAQLLRYNGNFSSAKLYFIQSILIKTLYLFPLPNTHNVYFSCIFRAKRNLVVCTVNTSFIIFRK